MELEIRELRIDKIKPYAKNARINDKAVKSVMKSIEKNGYIAPIVVDENYVILAGHTRFKALKKLGYQKIDCVVKEGLTETQKKAYRIADNKTAEIAEWDFALRDAEIKELAETDYDLDALGFTNDELNRIISGGLQAVQTYYAADKVDEYEDDSEEYEQEKPRAEYPAPTFGRPAPNELLQDMMTTEFVDLTPKELFDITFTFDTKHKEKVVGFIKANGKKVIVEQILRFIEENY